MSHPAHFNQRARDEWIAQMASTVPEGCRVLDIGAGRAPYRPLFAHCVYETHDFAKYTGTSEGLLSEEWPYADLDYVSDITSIPVDDAAFDVVVCTEVLEHVPRPDLALTEIGRILADGGRAFITAPLGSGLHQQPFHFYGGFTPEFYHHFLPEAGLHVESIVCNGRFFRLLAQELHRSGTILQRHRSRWPWWNPVRLAIRIALSRRTAEFLVRVDDEIPVSEFTAGYHVAARRAVRTLS